MKEVHTVDLVVLPAEWGSGRRKGMLSNLHLGARRDDGAFCMVGKTFKGLTDAMLGFQTARLQEIETHRDGHVVHVRPELVVEIRDNDVQRSVGGSDDIHGPAYTFLHCEAELAGAARVWSDRFMIALQPCERCKRHVRTDEPCAFCVRIQQGTSIDAARGGIGASLARTVAVASAAALALAGCDKEPVAPESPSPSASAASTGPSMAAMPTAVATDTPAPTVQPVATTTPPAPSVAATPGPLPVPVPVRPAARYGIAPSRKP